MPTKKPADPFSTDVKETTVAETTSTNEITITLKGGSGFDSPWVVIRAADAASAQAILDDPALKALTDRTSEVGQYFAGLGKPAATAAPTAAPTPAQGSGRHCKHGERVMRSGTKNGKAWTGYFCPTPSGTADQCKPEFG